MKKLLGTLLLILCVCLPALADRPVDESINADPEGEVSIELLAGKVRVIGWDRNEVEVTGTLGDDVEELTVEQSGGNVSIEVELKHNEDKKGRNVINDGDVDLEIRVPRASSVELEAVSIDFSMDEVEGAIDLEAVSGDVSIRGSVRSAEIETVSGEIEFESDATLEEAEFENVSGNVVFRGDFAPGGEYSFESVSGNVTVFVTRNASAEFSVETFSGDIKNDFGERPEKDSEYAPGQSLEFSVGSGDASVEISSFSGRVEIRKE